MSRVQCLLEVFGTPDNVFTQAELHNVDVQAFFALSDREMAELASLVPWREFRLSQPLSELLVD